MGINGKIWLEGEDQYVKRMSRESGIEEELRVASAKVVVASQKWHSRFLRNVIDSIDQGARDQADFIVTPQLYTQ